MDTDLFSVIYDIFIENSLSSSTISIFFQDYSRICQPSSFSSVSCHPTRTATSKLGQCFRSKNSTGSLIEKDWFQTLQHHQQVSAQQRTAVYLIELCIPDFLDVVVTFDWLHTAISSYWQCPLRPLFLMDFLCRFSGLEWSTACSPSIFIFCNV